MDGVLFIYRTGVRVPYTARTYGLWALSISEHNETLATLFAKLENFSKLLEYREIMT